MACVFFEKGREGLSDTIDWLADTIKVALFRLSTTDVGIKAITGATNATPIVITATSHGFSNGDIVSISLVGGNLSANGVWKIANVASNTFELTDPVDSTNVAGSAAYTSGGYAVCLGTSASGDNLDDFDAAQVGSAVTLASKTNTAGVLDAADPTFTSVAVGAQIESMMIFKDTGAAATSRMLLFLDGRHIVTCAAAASAAATSVAVERLSAGIANGSVLTFSDGKTATLTAQANAGDRTITVSSLASGIAAGKRAEALQLGAGWPVTPNGNDLLVTFDNGANRIGKL